MGAGDVGEAVVNTSSTSAHQIIAAGGDDHLLRHAGFGTPGNSNATPIPATSLPMGLVAELARLRTLTHLAYVARLTRSGVRCVLIAIYAWCAMRW
jgi:hypothetical protein